MPNNKDRPQKSLDNLKKGKKINNEEVARKYQKKSVISRKKNAEDRKNLKLALEHLLENDTTLRSGETMSGAAAISQQLFNQALKGNVKAFETIRATVGQDPVQKVENVNIDAEYEEAAEYLRELRKRRHESDQEETD